MSQYDFSHIINITSCRIGKDYDLCESVIMFQWSLIHKLLSGAEFSKIRIKNFGNFEIKKSFLESYNKKMNKRVSFLQNEYNEFPGEKVKNLLEDSILKVKEFESIYKKYSKNESTDN